jgi:hypothetical protein
LRKSPSENRQSPLVHSLLVPSSHRPRDFPFYPDDGGMWFLRSVSILPTARGVTPKKTMILAHRRESPQSDTCQCCLPSFKNIGAKPV